ncbi:MAG TPA: DUF2339 domain-containing protein, partial [Phycisphaerae bacterium]|nr:DUF2339 domain-containing protein [Phycisphaerae bacterium]
MATAVELAVIEMQIVVREMNRRLMGIERRLGLEAAPVPAQDRGRGVTPLNPREAPVVTRRAAATSEPYEIAGDTAPPHPDAGTTEAETGELDFTEAPVAFEPAASGAVPAPPVVDAPRELPVMPPRGPVAPPPSATRVMEFLQTHVPAEKPKSTLETTLGIEVTSWVAAFAIMGGILFFLKLAMDNGTLFMQPWVRVVLAALAGAGMVMHGLWLQRRQMKVISAALMAAGVATLMSTVFAGNVGFAVPVFSRPVAFLLLPVVAALGIALALRQRWIAMALMSFAGMYISPWILQGTTDHSRVILTYLLLVTACCISLAAIKKTWDLLRLLAFAAGWIALIGWAGDIYAAANFGEGLLFIAAFFLLYLADLFANLSRALAADPAQAPQTSRTEYWDLLGAIFSAVNTALALAAAALLFDKAQMHGFWFVTLLAAGTMAAVSRSVGGRYFAWSAEI